HLFGIREGIAILAVTPDSPAARAGLKGLSGSDEKPVLGDVIMTFQGKPVNSDIDLADRLDLLPPETPLDFEILRGDKTITITLRPWEKAPEVKVTVPV
ncbi:MAG: PDZ domain-containing protein, partial [Holophaga sp.]|nr:PDZ domain-containing protein [Holophaga sp.]